MNPRSTVVLLVVAAALGAFVWFWEIRGSEERKDAEQTARRLFPDVESGDVSFIALTTSDGAEARAERRDGAWHLVEPLAFPGDAVNLDAMAAGLADLARERELEEPQPPDVYGLGEDAREVRFGTAEAEHALRIGKTTPVGSNSYVSLGAEPARVFTVPTFRVTALERELADLRERKVLRFDRSSIAAIEVGWPDGEVALERVPDGAGWRITRPIEEPADDTTVDQLLSNLSYLRADDFVDEPADDETLGLDEPALRVRLATGPDADGEDASFRLEVGAERDGKRPVRSGEPSLYLVPAQRLGDFPRSLGAYRDKELARFVATDASRVELAFHPPAGEPETRLLEQGESGWTGEPGPVDPGRVARLVAELARLRGEDVVAEEAGPERLAELGLSPPRLRVRVLGGEGADGARETLAEVDVGEAEGDEEETGPVARTPGGRLVVRLPTSVEEVLATTPAEFDALFRPEPGTAAADGAGAAADPGGTAEEAAADADGTAAEAAPGSGAAEAPGHPSD